MTNFPHTGQHGFCFEDGEQLSFGNFMKLLDYLGLESMPDPSYNNNGFWNLTFYAIVPRKYRKVIEAAILEEKNASNSGS